MQFFELNKHLIDRFQLLDPKIDVQVYAPYAVKAPSKRESEQEDGLKLNKDRKVTAEVQGEGNLKDDHVFVICTI